jgi:hypothetical protein
MKMPNERKIKERKRRFKKLMNARPHSEAEMR